MATQISFHSMKTAVQIDFIPARFKKDTNSDRLYFEKSGSILIQMAMGEKKTYDWSKKTTFAISVHDLPMIYEAFIDFRRNKGKMDLTLYHDPGAQTEKQGQTIKTLKLLNGQTAGTFVLMINYKQNGKESLKTFHYIKTGELKMLENLFNSSLSYMIGLPQLSQK